MKRLVKLLRKMNMSYSANIWQMHKYISFAVTTCSPYNLIIAKPSADLNRRSKGTKCSLQVFFISLGVGTGSKLTMHTFLGKINYRKKR